MTHVTNTYIYYMTEEQLSWMPLFHFYFLPIRFRTAAIMPVIIIEYNKLCWKFLFNLLSFFFQHYSNPYIFMAESQTIVQGFLWKLLQAGSRTKRLWFSTGEVWIKLTLYLKCWRQRFLLQTCFSSPEKQKQTEFQFECVC